MPTIPVTPESLSANAGGGPLIGGVHFRRPTERTRTVEPVRGTVELGNGDVRTYDKGRRVVVSLAWAKLTEDEAALLDLTLAAPFVTYADDADAVDVFTMTTDEPLTLAAVPGTHPVRYEASVTLRERKPSR